MPFGVLEEVLKGEMKSAAGSDASSWLLQRPFHLEAFQISVVNLEHHYSHSARIFQRLRELPELSFEEDEGDGLNYFAT